MYLRKTKLGKTKMILFEILLFSLAGVYGKLYWRSDVESTEHLIGTWTYGDWDSYVYCNEGEYASGFWLFFDNKGGDDEGAVSVILRCRDPKRESYIMEDVQTDEYDRGLINNYHGVWDIVGCDYSNGETIQGFRAIDGYSSSYGMINMEAICTDGDLNYHLIRPHDGVWDTYYPDNSWYDYGKWSVCQNGFAVCGYKQKIDTTSNNDWSGINQIEFKCCPLPSNIIISLPPSTSPTTKVPTTKEPTTKAPTTSIYERTDVIKGSDGNALEHIIGIYDHGIWETKKVYCDDGEFASGINLFFDNQAGLFGDDEAAISVTLLCRHPNDRIMEYEELTSDDYDIAVFNDAGIWEAVNCDYANGKSIKGFKSLDGTSSSYGMVNIKALCTDNQEIMSHIDLMNNVWDGYYTENNEYNVCGQGSAICGYKQRIDPTGFLEDDTGLNQLAFYCCPL